MPSAMGRERESLSLVCITQLALAMRCEIGFALARQQHAAGRLKQEPHFFWETCQHTVWNLPIDVGRLLGDQAVQRNSNQTYAGIEWDIDFGELHPVLFH